MEDSPTMSVPITDYATETNGESTETINGSQSVDSLQKRTANEGTDLSTHHRHDHCHGKEDVTGQNATAGNMEGLPTVESIEPDFPNLSSPSSHRDDSDNVNTPRQEDNHSKTLQEEVNELRETLIQLSEQAKKDKIEQEELKKLLYENRSIILGPHPLPVLEDNYDVLLSRYSLRREARRNPEEDQFDFTGLGDHKRRVESMYKRELSYLEDEKKLHTNYRREISAWEEKERMWTATQTHLERLLEEERARPRLQTSSRGPSPAPSHSTVSREPAPVEPKVETEQVTESLPKCNIPKLNRVEWKLFKAIPSVYNSAGKEDQFHAIDILVGDPDISFESMNSIWYLKNGRRGKHSEIRSEHKAAITQKKQLGSGQAPVAERIRIHSIHIIKILENIHGESLTSESYISSVLMIRPFRTLVYYGEQILQKFRELELEFGEKEEGADTTNATIIQSSEQQDYDADSVSREKEQHEREEQKEEKAVDEYTGSAVAYQQMKVLIEFINTEIQEKMDYLASGRCQKVLFSDLWYLFKPGDEVIERSRRQAFRVLRVTCPVHKAIPPWRDFKASDSEGTPVNITCVYIDFDGKQFGPVTKEFVIKSFNGEKLITSLEIYPLSFVKEDVSDNSSENGKKIFRQRLIERGRMFLDVAKVKHMHYNGYTIDTGDEVDSQVVIDFEEAFSKTDNNCQAPTFETLIGSSQEDTGDQKTCSEECCRNENIHRDHYVEKRRVDDYIAGLIPQDKITEPSVSIFPRHIADTRAPEKAIPENDLVIMSYRVFGYVLRSRKWAQLDLRFLSGVGAYKGELFIDDDDKNKEGKAAGDNVVEKSEEGTAFGQLVLPPGHKDMVKSLVAQHFRDKEAVTAQSDQTDLVRGKGKGLIILLHGAPGVGKTTTAEGVAELFKKPLFQITCGDLGTTASDVEKALETHFSLANRWGCILLLDEADVFLSARSPHDFKRNGLVAVFLRVLEYYAGVLFLTTNRIGDFDEAFASRIHISLHYPQLDLESTVKVFELNLDLINKRFKEKNRDIMIERDNIIKFAEESWNKQKKMRWNGRQIRNACQTALALAEFDAQGGNHETIIDKHAKVQLTLKHLETVGVAYRDFIKYLEDVYDRDSDLRAKVMRIRAREEKMKAKAIDPARVNGKKEEEANHDGNEWETDTGDLEVRNEGKGEAGAKTRADVPSTQTPVEAYGMPPQGYPPYQTMYPPPSATAPQYAPPGAGGQVPPPGQYWWPPYPGYGQPQGPPPGPPPGPTPTHR